MTESRICMSKDKDLTKSLLSVIILQFLFRTLVHFQPDSVTTGPLRKLQHPRYTFRCSFEVLTMSTCFLPPLVSSFCWDLNQTFVDESDGIAMIVSKSQWEMPGLHLSPCSEAGNDRPAFSLPPELKWSRGGVLWQ